MSGRRWAGLLGLTGLLVAASGVWHVVALVDEPWSLHLAIDVLLLGSAGLGFAYGAVWFATRDVPAGHRRGLLAWIVTGGALAASLGVVGLRLGSEAITPVELIEAVHVTGSVGLLGGLLVGMIYARAIESAEAAARAEAEAEALAAERDRMEHLNDLLRHYILNGVNVISGYTDLLRSDASGDRAAALDTIDDRARMIATLIRHVRSIQPVDRPSGTRPLADILSELSAQSGVRRDTSVGVPDPAPAVGVDASLERALPVLCDALERVTDAGGAITVTCDHDDRSATIALTATPARLPEAVERSAFEPITAGTGLELYLADQLLSDACELSLVENAGDRVRIEIVVPAVRPAGGDAG